MMGIGMAVRPPRQLSLMARAISAIRRNNGTLIGIPDNFAGAYIDSAGTQPVTAVGDVLGLLTDRSYGAGNLGAELVTSSWTPSGTGVSESGGVITFASSPSSDSIQNTGIVVSGKSYRATFTVSGFSGSGGVSLMVAGNSVGTVATANGTYTQVFVAATSGALGIRARLATTTAVVSGLTTREVLGNHATQPTTASKPTVTRVPKRTRGPVNQLMWSGDFSNAAWVKQQLTVATNATPAPNGGACFKLTEDTATALHRVEQNWTAVAGATYTIAVVAKSAERTWARLYEDSGGCAVWVNLADGTLGSVSNGNAVSAHLGNGWHLLVITYVQTGTVLRFRLSTATANNIGSYTGDGTSGILLHRAALFQGTVTAQQIIDNGGIPLTTTQPLPNVLEWTNAISFDGNDFLQTSITTGNEGWVCAGVTFGGAAAANETVFEAGAVATTTNKGFWLFRWGNASANWLEMRVGNGATVTTKEVSTIPLLGVPRVVEGGWDASTVLVGVDGVISTKTRTGDASPSGTPLRIGAYQGAANFLQGGMSVQVICPTLPPAADRALIRRWIGSLQGQTL